MTRVCLLVAAVALSCGAPPVTPEADAGSTAMSDGGQVTFDAGQLDAGDSADAGDSSDAGGDDAGSDDAGADAGNDAGVITFEDWRFIPIAGSKCARGAQTGFGYAAGSPTELLLYLQGGGACWNTGTCQPSVQQWGPICNYASNSVCLWNEAGGTQPLAVFVSHPDPFPADGGGAFPSELGSVKSSLLFSRRADNPLHGASMVFVPYCTGDLHSGDAERTYLVKNDLVSQPVGRTHYFNGAKNLDLFLSDLRARHPRLDRVWLIGVSAGGYGAQLNLHRVRAAFPEADVQLLADSAPMLPSPHYDAWKTAWNLQYPPGCGAACDGGLDGILEQQLTLAPNTRAALLAYREDQVITRFFYSGGSTSSWLTPPFSTYRGNLNGLLGNYPGWSNARAFVVAGQDHVMLQGYGVVQSDGGVTAPRRSDDGGVSLKDWVDAWVAGSSGWSNSY